MRFYKAKYNMDLCIYLSDMSFRYTVADLTLSKAEKSMHRTCLNVSDMTVFCVGCQLLKQPEIHLYSL